MEKILTLILLSLSLNGFAQSQAEMNRQAYDEFNQSDRKLNEIYHAILSGYKSDTLFVKNLRKSQRIWIQFRDAEMEMKYPPYPGNFYGSIHSICRASFLKELTDRRIETLKVWLGGMEEGELCNGSVKTIKEIDPEYMGMALVENDSTIRMSADMKKDHRIFGYKEKDINSTKMILLSIFTNEVENNPFNCKYGSYYDTGDMINMKLKYLLTEGEFLKVGIMKERKVIEEVYMLKKWFAFEK